MAFTTAPKTSSTKTSTSSSPTSAPSTRGNAPACASSHELPYDAVIFDFDGTLANTKDHIIAIAKRVLAHHNLAPERYADLPQLIGPAFPQAFSIVFGYSDKEAREITAEYRAIYTNLGVEAWPLFDGMHDLLVSLKKAGILLGVASSKRNTMLHHALQDNGVEQLFSCARGKMSDEAEPKAQVLAQVIRTLGVNPARTVMVGDRHYDIEAAKACNVASIGVYYGNTAPQGELEDAGADVVVHSVAQLKEHCLGRA